MKEKDAIYLWNRACLFTREKLLNGKAVRFSNIGHFYFTLVESFSELLRPTFVLSEKICHHHLLHQRKQPIAGFIPLVSLNISELSIQTEFPREVVESGLQDVHTTINQFLHEGKPVEISFDEIGQLRIVDGKTKFRFYRSFLRQIKNPKLLISAMQNRPDTADSVTTNRSDQSEKSLSSKRSSVRTLNLIPEESDEDCTAGNDILVQKEEKKSENVTEGTSGRFFPTPDTIPSTALIEERNHYNESDVSSQHSQLFPCESHNRTPSISKTVDASTSFRLNSDTKSTVHSRTASKSHIDFLPPVPRLSNNVSVPLDCSSCPLSQLSSPRRNSGSMASSRTSRARGMSSQTQRSINSHREQLTERLRALQSQQCSHSTDSVQDLCYVCHQRQVRNVAVDLKEEISNREKAEEELLAAYQQLHAQNTLKKEQERELARRTELTRQAAFNLGVADAKRLKKTFTDQSEYKTCILPGPNAANIKLEKQLELRTELDRQIAEKEQQLRQSEEDKRLLGRIEQIRLAEELSTERNERMRNKIGQQTAYKSALDFQVKHKPDPIPKVQENDGLPVFGAHHFNPVRLEQARERARDVQQAQVEACVERARRMKRDRELDQEYEKDILKRVHHDLICDGLKRREAQEAMRQYLETEWVKAMQEKQDRDQLERLLRKHPCDHTLHDQCSSLKRCLRCKRRLDNRGQCNLSVDNYAPGMAFVM